MDAIKIIDQVYVTSTGVNALPSSDAGFYRLTARGACWVQFGSGGSFSVASNDYNVFVPESGSVIVHTSEPQFNGLEVGGSLGLSVEGLAGV